MSLFSAAKARAGLFGLGLAFAASPLALAAVLEGTVSTTIDADAASAVFLEGAIVTIEETGQSAATGRDGSFRFSDVAPGDYTLNIDYFGAGDQTLAVTVTDDTRNFVAITLGAGDMTLAPVVVTGQAGAFFAARAQERASDNLITVLSSDAIGSLPDQNVAESLRRATGISIQLDQGEGRFVSIRGLDPSLNATSVNGVRLPAPEGSTRAVALDVIDSDALESIVINKSLTADMDADGLGGSIDIRTLTAFDRGGRYLRAKAEGIYSESSEEWGEKLNLTASDLFMDGRLGIAGSVTWNRRDFQTENQETDGPWVEFGDLRYPEEYEMRDYIVERERLSATLNFDYKLADHTDLYLRTLFNEFSDQEFRARVEVKTEDADPVGLTEEGFFNLSADDDQLEFDRDIKDRLEEQQIWSIQAGGETAIDAITFDYQVAYSHSEETEPDRIDADFRANSEDFDGVAELGYLLADPQRPRVAATDIPTFQYFYNPDNFEFDGLENLDGITEDDEWSISGNLKVDMELFNTPGFIKTGAKARLREKTRDVNATVYDGFDGDDLLLTQFAGMVDYPLDIIGTTPDPGSIRSFFKANQDLFEVSDADTAIASNAEDYKAEENIYAAYVMAQAQTAVGVTVNAGLRLEATDISAQGRIVAETDGTVDIPDAVLLADGEVAVAVNRERNSYRDLLPSLNLKYDSGEMLVFRAAYYQSIARPNFSDFVPSAELEVDEGDVEGVVGNPDLDRQKAENIDLSMDLYISDNSVFSLGAFWKDIDDFIANVTFQDTEFFGLRYDEATQAQNLSEGEVRGFEMSYTNVFDGLPSPFDGLIAGVNYTRVTGSSEFQGREINLPRLSDHIANLIVGYEKYGLDLRASLNYRSEFLDELNTGGPGIDRYVDERLQLDLAAKYDITDQFQISAEIQNITDEPFEAYLRDGSRKLLSQYEEYGYTARVGVRFRY